MDCVENILYREMERYRAQPSLRVGEARRVLGSSLKEVMEQTLLLPRRGFIFSEELMGNRVGSGGRENWNWYVKK